MLDEAAWREALPATDFIQNRPNPGPHEKHPTEVRMLYDDAAIYMGAVMHDVSPDSILRELTARDNFGNTDFIGIFLDTYHDQLNGYGFFVTTGGVQMDCPLLAGRRRRLQLERRVGQPHRPARHRLGGRDAHSVLGHPLQHGRGAALGPELYAAAQARQPGIFLERGEARRWTAS